MNNDFRLADWFIVYVAMLSFFAVGAITTLGLGWYGELILPAWMPSQVLIALIWCVLFILAARSAITVWDKIPHDRKSTSLVVQYPSNALLVLLWNYLFFGIHDLFLAFLAALLVLFSVVALMASTWHVSRRATWLLAPYLLWMIFATYLMHVVLVLNS